MASPTLFDDSTRTTSTWNKNRVDPFHAYGSVDQSGMQGLKTGEAQGGAALGFGMGAQKRSLNAYDAMAAGQGPSLAQDMMRRQTAQSIAAQQSMAAQAGGAGAFRNASMQGAAQMAAGNQSIAEIRAQEQLAAMQGSAGLASQMAGQGLQQQLGYAGMLNQAQISQMDAANSFALQQRALQEQERMGRFQRRMGWANFGVSTGGKVVEAIGSAVSASDERLKHNIQPAAGNYGAAANMAASINPATFDYNPGAGPAGNRLGVMAQDLEQTPQGAALVADTPQGKMVDTSQAALAGLAISADQEQRLRALEQSAPAGMQGAPSMPMGPQVMQPREVMGRDDLASRRSNVDDSLASRSGPMGDQMMSRVAEARDRLAQTTQAIDAMRQGTMAPVGGMEQRFGPGSVEATRNSVGSEIDRMQAEYDASNPFGVPSGSKPMESTSVQTGQSMGKAGGGGGGMGAGMMGMGAALGGMGGGGGGGGFGGGMQGFGAAMSDERRKRNVASGASLGSTVSQQKVRNAGGF